MIYTAEASSSADILSWGLLSEKAIVKASSSATIKTHASVNLKARASSSGSIIYHGACNVEKTISSGGAVTKKG